MFNLYKKQNLFVFNQRLFSIPRTFNMLCGGKKTTKVSFIKRVRNIVNRIFLFRKL